MSEEKDRSETSANEATGTALALAGASRAEADAFLRDQRHHMHEQLKQLHLDIFEKWLGVALRLATLCVGLGAATGVWLMISDAMHADGLRVESFSVPPDLAARGLTGEVVATRVVDRLSELQFQTNTARPARSYSNSWGAKAIKLEIPETGISLQELDSWLREKLGHETTLTGEVVRTATGVTLTARAGENGAVSVGGTEAEMDTLTGKLAEAIYRITQPYRHATWLLRHEGRAADALPIFKDLALNGSPADKLWSYNMWGQAVGALTQDTEAALYIYQQAIAADPEAIGVYTNLSGLLNSLGRYEESTQAAKEWLIRLGDGKQRYVPAAEIPVAKKRVQAYIDRYTGAYHDALVVDAVYLRTGLAGFGLTALMGPVISDQLGEHDLSAARHTLAGYPASAAADRFAMQIAFLTGNWNRALGLDAARTAYLIASPNDRHFAIVAYAWRLAVAQAHLGNFTVAERTIAPTPADCYPCLIARAQIAELQNQRARADWWFAKADAAAPSIPFAFYEEGKVLLARGRADEAIARFTLANQKSPHFADPLEGWGEALMAKNQSHLALAKFGEAEKYAPNWGRLHMKWGEALYYAGKRDDAKTQFARAATLDLTPSEKSELMGMPHG